nr:glycine betaine ABC transporter substrate-binding protein [uncultured Neokomagataea sp.]
MTQMIIGHLYTALHAGCASAVARVLEAHDVEVDFLDLDPDDISETLESGEVDLLVSAWFPRDEGIVPAGARVIGNLYQPRATFAALSALGPVNTLSAAHVERLIVAEEARDALDGALKRLPALSSLPLEVVGEAALLGRLEKAKASGEKVLVAAMQPHAVFHSNIVTLVDDPEELLGGELSARMILTGPAAARADSDLIDELSEMMLGNKVMSALDYAIGVEEQDPEEAAESWQRGRLIPRDA